MLNLLSVLEVVEYRLSICVFHKKKASEEIETKVKTGFLIEKPLFFYFCQRFADFMAIRGHFPSLAPLISTTAADTTSRRTSSLSFVSECWHVGL